MERDRSGRVRASEREARLVAIMGEMAGGDAAAVFALREEFRSELVGALRRVGRARHAAFTADELEDLLTDACMELFAVAGAWDPAGGAKPWNWAHHRLANLVDGHLGQWTRPLDPALEQGLAEQAGEPAGPSHEPEVLAVFEDLAGREPRVALLRDAMGRIASPIDAEIFLEIAVQSSLGDRSPAVTVARARGIRPDAVRQKTHRVRVRLRALAESDPHFADLADLALVA